MVKKILAIFLATMMLVCFAGCQDNTQSGGGDAKVYKIGVSQFLDHASLDNCRDGFVQGLENAGFVDGENIEITFKSAQGDGAIASQIAQTFAGSGMDLVCGIATPAAQSLYSVCLEQGIPVVFNAVSDPVFAKLAVSETEPMEGITGVSDQLPVEAQLKMIRQILPDAKKIGILYTTSEDNSVSTLETYKKLAGEYGFEIVDKGVGNQAEIPAALDVILPQVDCISNMTDNTVVGALGVVLEKANEQKIPVFGSEVEQVKNGCLACEGLDYVQLGVQAGEIAGRILNGEKAEDIPFEIMKESQFTVNQTVAENLGIEIPAELTERAEIVS